MTGTGTTLLTLTALSVLVGAAAIIVYVALDRANARRCRVVDVVSEYRRLAFGHPVLDTGPSAFIKAGARGLKNDREVRAAIGGIMARGGSVHLPLGSRTAQILGAVGDLRAFLDEIGEQGELFDAACRHRGI